MLSFFPRGVLDEILNLIESVSEDFPSYSCSYSYIGVRSDSQTEPPVEYRGPNAAQHLLESLQEEESKIKCVLADPKAMMMTREAWLAFRTTETCHVCDKPLESDSVTTATLRVNIEGQPITSATSSYG